MYFNLKKIYIYIVFPSGSEGKESACNMGDLGLIPGLGRSPGGGKGCPLENSMDWVEKSWTRLRDFHFLLECL